MEPRTAPDSTPIARTLAALQIRPEEVVRTFTLFGMSFCALAIQVLSRTARDTLFLSRYDPEQLPWMFILYGFVSVGVGLLFSRVAPRFRLHRMLYLSLGVGAVTYVVAYGLILAGVTFIYPAFYVWADVTFLFLFVQIWAIASSLHTAREAKRLFGVIGAGGVLGTVLSGVTVGAMVRTLGIPSLLLFAVLLMGALGWLTSRVARFPPVAPDRKHDPGHEHAPQTPRRYVAALGAMLLCTFTVATVADYQFKLIARESFDEIQLAHYFALFYAAVGSFSLVFHLFVTPRVLQRAGVLWGLLFMPGVMACGLAAVTLLPTPATGAFLKFGDLAFQFTINNASYQILYLPFPARIKPRLVSLLDGMLKPLGYAAGGAVLLVAATYLEVRDLSFAALPLALLWIGLIFVVRGGYVRALAATLDQRRWLSADDVEVALDRAAADLLRKTLCGPDPARARFAAERLLADPQPDLPALAGDLLTRPDPELRVLALRAVRAHGLEALRERALDLLRTDSAPEVRAAAAEAVAAVSEDPCEALEPLLSDPHPPVRAAAVCGLLRIGSLECVLAAGPLLRAMATAGDPLERARAARILGRVGNPRFYRPLSALLGDPEKEVRRAACEATRELLAPELLGPLLGASRKQGSRAAAAFTLRSFEDRAVPGIEEALAHSDTDAEARRHLAKTLGVVGSDQALTALLRRLSAEEDPRVRDALWKSVVRAVVRGGRELPRWCDLKALTRRELRLLYVLAQGFEAALESCETPLLAMASQSRLALARGRVLRALEARYREPGIGLARKRIDAREPTARANAHEILSVVLDWEDRRAVLPFFEPTAARERLLMVGKLLDLAPRSAEEALAAGIRRADPWMKVCALHAAAVHGVRALREAAEAALADPVPLVREAAAMALTRIGDRPLGEREVAMFTLLEKVVLLKGVGLFSEVPGDDLTALVQAAEEVSPAPGEAIIHEGEPGDTLYAVLHGSVRVERGGRLLARLGPGECFGELAIIDQEPRSATVIAEEGTTLLAIAQEDFHELLADHPDLATSVLRVISRRLREATKGSESPG